MQPAAERIAPKPHVNGVPATTVGDSDIEILDEKGQGKYKEVFEVVIDSRVSENGCHKKSPTKETFVISSDDSNSDSSDD